MEPFSRTEILNTSEFITPNPTWWWFVFGFFAFVAVIFFLVTVYHWLRYETNSKVSTIVISLTGIVSAALLGGAMTSLGAYLSLIK
jgi:CDP-diglyceride synthetase